MPLPVVCLQENHGQPSDDSSEDNSEDAETSPQPMARDSFDPSLFSNLSARDLAALGPPGNVPGMSPTDMGGLRVPGPGWDPSVPAFNAAYLSFGGVAGNHIAMHNLAAARAAQQASPFGVAANPQSAQQHAQHMQATQYQQQQMQQYMADQQAQSRTKGGGHGNRPASRTHQVSELFTERGARGA